MIELEQTKHRVRLRLRVLWSGSDLCVILDGGDRAHTGAVSLAAHAHATQTLCLRGHREDELSARVAESIHAQLQCTVTCLCGIHIDNISKDEIALVFTLTDELVDTFIAMHKGQNT